MNRYAVHYTVQENGKKDGAYDGKIRMSSTWIHAESDRDACERFDEAHPSVIYKGSYRHYKAQYADLIKQEEEVVV